MAQYTDLGLWWSEQQRPAAQKRDALIMRCLIRLIRWCLITSGAGTTADRGSEPA